MRQYVSPVALNPHQGPDCRIRGALRHWNFRFRRNCECGSTHATQAVRGARKQVYLAAGDTYIAPTGVLIRLAMGGGQACVDSTNYASMRPCGGAVTLANGVAFGCNMQGTSFALNAKTGSSLWEEARSALTGPLPSFTGSAC